MKTKSSFAVRRAGLHRLHGFLTAFASLVVAGTAPAQPGALDLPFNAGLGTYATRVPGVVHELLAQPDGKLLVAGQFDRFDGQQAGGLVRLNADGTVDSGFSVPRGIAEFYLTRDKFQSIRALALQPDGKIMVGGEFTYFENVTRHILARLHPDGRLDTTFRFLNVSSNYFYDVMEAVAVLPDGKILAAGLKELNDVGSALNWVNIVRLNADGSPDATFAGPRLGANIGSSDTPFIIGANVHAMLVQPGGQIYLGFDGDYQVTNAPAAPILRKGFLRLNSEGVIDETFQVTGLNRCRVFAAAQQADGKFLLAGTFTDSGDVSLGPLVRLNANGTVDGSFQIRGITNGSVSTIVAQGDGRILIGGTFTAYGGAARGGVARMNPDGSLDTTFVPAPAVVQGGRAADVRKVLPQGGQVLIGGDFLAVGGVPRRGVARLLGGASGAGAPVIRFPLANASVAAGEDAVFRVTADGAASLGYRWEFSGQPIPGETNAVLRVPAVQLAQGGSYTVIVTNGLGEARSSATLAVSTPTTPTAGSVDGAFRVAFDDPAPQIKGSVVQADGRVVFIGAFTSIGGVARPGVARVLANGQLDATFNPGSGPDAAANALALQPDGKVVIVGGFTNFNGMTQRGFVRLNTDGSVDATLNTGLGANAEVTAVATQSDGRVLLGGKFTSVNGTSAINFARLSAAGVVETAFSANAGYNGGHGDILAILVQSDRRIVVGGLLHYVKRFNADGSPDSSFVASAPLVGFTAIYALAQQPSGRIVVGGAFNGIPGYEHVNVFRVHTDGRLDRSFTEAASCNVAVKALAVQADGKIVVGGNFSVAQGIPRGGVTRLLCDGELDLDFLPGLGADDFVNSVALLGDGKVLVTGRFTNVNGTTRKGLARLHGGDGPPRAPTITSTLTVQTVNSGEDTLLQVQATGRPGLTYQWFRGAQALAGETNAALLLSGVQAAEAGTYSVTVANAVGTPSYAVQLNVSAPRSGPGSLDHAFRPRVELAGGAVYSLAAQPDGKLLLGGRFASAGGRPSRNLTRLSSDGTVDPSFYTGPGADDLVGGLAVQPDGRIWAAGSFKNVGGAPTANLVRLNRNGSRDPAFNSGFATDNFLNAVLVLGNGDVLVGGEMLARYHADGACDPFFRGNARDIYALAEQPDGRIVIAGGFSTVNGVGRVRVARLLANGDLDNTFNAGTGPNQPVLAVAIAPDGKILIGGEFTSVAGSNQARVARLNANGSLDTTFSASPPDSGTGFTYVSALALRGDGKLWIGGNFNQVTNQSRKLLALLGSDGALDLAVNPPTEVGSEIRALLLQPDGLLLAAGDFSRVGGQDRFCVARFNPDGTLHGSLAGRGVLAAGDIYNSAAQPDGKTVIAGLFTHVNGAPRQGIARLNADGTTDAGFDPGDGADAEITALAIAPDGKILIAGFFFSYQGQPRAGMARLNADGRLDGTFLSTGSSGLGNFNVIAAQDDGTAFLGGTGGRKVVKYLNSGQIDPGFVASLPAGGLVKGLAVLDNGQVIVGGGFSTRLARLNANGSADATFTPPQFATTGSMDALALQSDGRIVGAGSFTTTNGPVRSYLARFNANGTLDTGFAPVLDNSVRAMLLQTNGQIAAFGPFTTVNGQPRRYLARFNPDGTPDPAFDGGTGPDATAPATGGQRLAQHRDGRIVLFGQFVRYDGFARLGIARIQGGDGDFMLLSPTRAGSTFSVNVLTLIGRTYTLESKSDLSQPAWSTVVAVPGDGAAKALSDGTGTGLRRFYRVRRD